MDLSERPKASFRRHPWEVARYRFFETVLRDHGLLHVPQRVLDVGCGDGWFLSQLMNTLPASSSALGWDLAYDANTLPLETGGPRVRFAREEPETKHTLLLLLDVLEHIEEDAAFLVRRLEKNAEAGAGVLVSVPVWPSLWTAHDVALGHVRRYLSGTLLRLLEASGLAIVAHGGLFHSLVAPRAIQAFAARFLGARRGRPETLEWRGPEMIGRAVEAVLAGDNAVARRLYRAGWHVPGLSYWALCKTTASGARG